MRTESRTATRPPRSHRASTGKLQSRLRSRITIRPSPLLCWPGCSLTHGLDIFHLRCMPLMMLAIAMNNGAGVDFVRMSATISDVAGSLPPVTRLTLMLSFATASRTRWNRRLMCRVLLPVLLYASSLAPLLSTYTGVASGMYLSPLSSERQRQRQRRRR